MAASPFPYKPVDDAAQVDSEEATFSKDLRYFPAASTSETQNLNPADHYRLTTLNGKADEISAKIVQE